MHKLQLRPRTITIIAAVCAFFLFIGFRFFTYRPQSEVRLDASWLSNSPANSDDCIGDEPGSMMFIECSCPDVNSPPIGFPFRANKYDRCRADSRVEPQIVALNYLLQIGFAGLFFIFLKKLLRRLS